MKPQLADMTGGGAQPMHAVSPALLPRRRALYFVLNFGFLIFIAMAAAMGAGTNPRVVYLCLLFAACSSTLLYVEKPNGPHAILIVLLAFYFVCYGLADTLSLFIAVAAPVVQRADLLTLAEFAVVLGAVLLTIGYNTAVAMMRRARTTRVAGDWPASTAIIVGFGLWVVGIASNWMWASEVVDRYIVGTELGPVQAAAVTLARYAQPVGIALVAYRFVKSRGLLLTLLVLGMLGVEFVFGFVADSKELSIRGAALVIVASYFLHGKVPKAWLGMAALVIIIAFPVFSAYRFEVLQEGKQTRSEGVQNLGKNLQTALQSSLASKSGIQRADSAFGRLSLKPTMELIIARVGQDVAYQDGHTLGLFFLGFVPRILWPSKPDSSVGQLFNRQFKISEDPDTYISATQLGELYWNFGWAGVVVGMSLMGFLLGYIGTRFSLAEHKSVTRFLVLALTVYLLCLRFEGGIAMTYTLWLRSVALVLLLHAIFARGGAQAVAAAGRSSGDATDEGRPAAKAFLPNLMR